MIRKADMKDPDAVTLPGKKIWGIDGFFGEVFSPHVLLTGFFIGLFHTTNFWDFPIYYVVSGAIILFSNAVIYNFFRSIDCQNGQREYVFSRRLRDRTPTD